GQVAERAARVAHEEERDDLEDPLAVPGVDVADVAELAERAAVRAGLLRHLAQGRRLAALAGVDVPLRQRPHRLALALGPDRGHHPAAVQPPDEHAARGELSLHAEGCNKVDLVCTGTVARLACEAVNCPGTRTAGVPDPVTKSQERRRGWMNLQPLGDRLIVEALEDEETTASGIVLPDTAKEKPQRGRVLAVGP